MMPVITIGKWPDEIHDLPEQRKRLTSAMRKDTAPQTVDRENLTGIFKGSGREPYQVTIHSCTCRDFQLRHKPCKHIYRLAMECGLFDSDSAEIDKGSIPVAQITLKDAVGILENLTDECQILLKGFMWNDKGAVHSVELSDTYRPLLQCSLIEIVSPTVDSVYYYKAKELIDICMDHGYSPPLRTTKKKLAAWCVENAPDCFLSFRFAPSFQKKRPKVYIYLCRKYDWDSYWAGDQEILYPWHSKQRDDGVVVYDGPSRSGIRTGFIVNDGRYYFPDDEITKLLTLYGYNRCLNGFEASQIKGEID